MTVAASFEDYPGAVLRVFGPPGTGKTDYLSRRVRSTVAEYGPASVLIASFSTTAAQEIASRFGRDEATRPPSKAIGTLHSHAYRACEHPTVALDRKVVADWNSQVEPELKITPDTRRADGSEGGGSFVSAPENAVTGDELLGALDRLRAAQFAPEDWPPNVREFAARWGAWKADVGAIDFSDMIEGALLRARDGEPAPGRPSRLVIDEAQDLTPLEISLALAWGKHAQRLVLGMDDDQAINRWRGGDPEPLLNLAGPNVQDHVLDQSYRVPSAVRAVAEQWVRRLSHRREKEYHPRLDDGGNEVQGAAYRVPYTINSATLVTKALEEADAGRDVMIVTTCNYLLEPLIKNLRAEGAPFHNPYRPGEARWNPLGRPSGEDMITTAERIRRYLTLMERDWTGADVQAWSGLIKLRDAGMRANAKRLIAAFDPRAVVPFEEIAALFADERALERATEPSVDWLGSCLLKDKQDPAEYPLHLARVHGVAALDRKPNIVVGTIHSVKGAAARIVYVSPDISAAAARSMSTRAGVDEAIRQFYVALTRAYDEVRLLAPATSQHLRPDELIPSTLEVFPT
jgi:superfamily I DNA/RNA helicase